MDRRHFPGDAGRAVPLSVVAVAYYSRLVEQSLLEVPKEVMEAAASMGHPHPDDIQIPVCRGPFGPCAWLTTSTISFISYSTVMGIVGGVASGTSRSVTGTSDLRES